MKTTKLKHMNSTRWFLKGMAILSLCTVIQACQPSASVEDSKEEATTLATESKATSGQERKKIVFFGNSLTAGYGLDPEDNFVSIIQTYIDSLGLPYQTVNAGVSGETTSGGNSRIDWILEQPLDVFILELGGNDGLRGIDPDETRDNLEAMIRKVKSAKPDAHIILAGMQVPPNMGPDYAEKFSRIYPELAKSENIALIPFLLENVGGEPELNLDDGIHPNEEGHQIVANNVWLVLKDIIQ
jgi:acyl-CoA thioesterase-1